MKDEIFLQNLNEKNDKSVVTLDQIQVQLHIPTIKTFPHIYPVTSKIFKGQQLQKR